MNNWVDSVFNTLSPEGRIGQLIVAAVTPSSNDATRELVRRLVVSGIPVLGHLGLLPQSIQTAGGYKVVGRTEAAAAPRPTAAVVPKLTPSR